MEERDPDFLRKEKERIAVLRERKKILSEEDRAEERRKERERKQRWANLFY